ncbi:DUF3486 family protein [Xanthobacter autotrophicus]|uniref:DUF3486 family protein n=1 Tax=Xanthobacter TaxID=279 RepID=UPI0024AA4259|nr:DUF3486 family protein [Xanthobacter autotrophicus]MDI4664701.1 DUF3486 family protein [Xanthobacter autotrophicus]
MGKRSSVDALPQEVKDWLMRLREQGATYDQIVAKLRELDNLAVVPSRSALHRHIQEAERTKEMVDRQRIVAEAMVKDLGEVDDSRVTRGNIAMLHAILTRVQQTAIDAMMTGDGSIDMSPGEIMQLAKALDHLGKTAKDDVARTMAIEKRAFEKARAAAAAVAVGVAQEAGLSAERIAEIRRGVLGLRHTSTPTSQPEDIGDA